jgi:hypothetical protein
MAKESMLELWLAIQTGVPPYLSGKGSASQQKYDENPTIKV